MLAQGGRKHEDAPDAIDHRGYRRQQLNHERNGLGDFAGCLLDQEDRDAETHWHCQQQRNYRRNNSAIDEG